MDGDKFFCGYTSLELKISDQNGWDSKVAYILKVELKRKGITYGQLAERLKEYRLTETEKNLHNKLTRGEFSAAFFLLCFDAIGEREIRL